MTIPTLNQNIYYQNDTMSSNEDSTNQASKKSVEFNDLNSVYIDLDVISELTLKAAHTPEILAQKIKENQENRSLKNIDFDKESKTFDKSNLNSVSGDLKTTQANISSKRVMELLN